MTAPDPGTLKAELDAIWAESQADDMVIRDAGIMQDIVLRLRALLAAVPARDDLAAKVEAEIEAQRDLTEATTDWKRGYRAGMTYAARVARALLADPEPDQ